MKTQKRIAMAGILAVFAIALVIVFLAACKNEPDLPVKTLTGITLNTASVKKAYVQNETLNLAGLVVTALYSDSSSAIVANYTTNPANGAVLFTIGQRTVTVSYTEGAVTKTADFTVTFTAVTSGKTLTGITAEYNGTTVIYPDTTLDTLKAGLTVKAQYNDGSETTLLGNEYTLDSTLTIGTSTITVTYQVLTTTFTVNVSTPEYWLITWEFNGGISGTDAEHPAQILKGTVLAKPSPNPTKDDSNFGGWYTDSGLTLTYDFNSPVISDLILYAKWEPPFDVPGTNLAAKLQWLASNAESDTNYILEATEATEYLNPQTLSYSGKSNITIKLTSTGSVKNVELYGTDSLFTIENSVTLILENIIIIGSTYNNAALISVNSSSNLILNQYTKITGSTGGGVYVSNGTFTMNGGDISDNISYGGGGVYVSNGTFTMNGGEISGNDSITGGGGVYVGNGTFTMNGGDISDNTSYGGGGVYVSNGTFTMNGGEISGNTAYPNPSSYGGGVYMLGGTFTMNGGNITNNASYSISSSDWNGDVYSYSYGSGVYVKDGNFKMNDGEISDNTAASNSDSSSDSSHNSSYSYSYGSGVYVSNGTFIMSGGKIIGNALSSNSSCNPYHNSSHNYSYSYGGGVYVSGTFTMSGGEITGNTSSSSSSSSYSFSYYSYSYGGGVYVSGTFIMSGGTITGYASDIVNGNVVKDDSGVIQNGSGHAIYVTHIDNRFIRRKETTSSSGDNLSYILNEPAPPTINGAWDE